jgi:uncharacterized iron-regulated membrane protein
MRNILNKRAGMMTAVDTVVDSPASPAKGGATDATRRHDGLWRRVVRPTLFWTHLVAGLAFGAVVFVMAITGVALTYQKQVTAWADVRGLHGTPPMPGAERLPADSLIARGRRAADATPTNIVWRAAADRPVELVFPEGRRLFLNAYTGDVLGSGSTSTRKFFRLMTDWHRWLAMSGEGRAKGRAITGVSNLAFLVLVLSGIWLWWPKNRSRVAFRNVTSFRRGVSSKARDFNWHNVIGFWSFVPLVIVVASGVVISYPWASDLVYRAAGETPPRRASASPSRGPRPEGTSTRSTEGQPVGLDAGLADGSSATASRVSVAAALNVALAVAAQRMPDWRTISLALPRSDTASFAFTLDRGTGGEPHKRAQLALGPDGRLAKWQTFDDQSRARQWRSVLRFAHTGEVLGLMGQTIAGLVSLGATLLVYTGGALSWRRWRAWRKRRAEVSLRAGTA